MRTKRPLHAVNFFLLMVMLTPAVWFTACKKPANENGSMMIWMCYAPCEYKKMNVEIRSFDIHYTNEKIGSAGWVNVQSTPGVYDILELNNPIGSTMAEDYQLPPGTIDKVRFVPGDDHSLVTKEGDTIKVVATGDVKNGIIVDLNSEISPGHLLDIQLDINAAKSVVQSENTYYLKPVIQLNRIGFHED